MMSTAAPSLPDTPFMAAVLEVIRRIERTIPEDFQGRIKAVLVGGAAVHVHTAARVSHDVEAVFDHRILLPGNIVVRYRDEDGEAAVALDTNYASEVALLHPDAMDDAPFLARVGRIDVHVLHPVDLAVTKIGRWQGNDAADVAALARAGLLDREAVARRTREALSYFVGGTGMIEHNLRDALESIPA